MKSFTLLLCVACIALALHPCEAKKKDAARSQPAANGSEAAAPRLISSNLSGKDLEFLWTAAELGRLESWLGVQADKAETDQIKAVGKPLVEAEAEEDKYLKQLAEMKGIDLSQQPASPELKKLSQQFDSLKGAKFDKALMDKIAAVNRQEVSAFEAATHSSDADIKQFAERVLPVAKEKLLLFDRMTGAAQRTSVSPAFRTDSSVKPHSSD